MNRQPAPLPDAPSPSGARAVAVLGLAIGAAVGLSTVIDGSWDGGRAPGPYAWADVMLVHFVCALPLALMLASLVYGRLPPAATVGIAVGGFAVATATALDDMPAGASPEAAVGLVLRALPALGLAFGTLLLVATLAGTRHPRVAAQIRLTRAALFGALGVAALLLPPVTYVGARCRHDIARLGELLEQSRFGEARVLVRGLLILDAERTWNGHPLPEVAEQVERVVKGLESRVASPLRPNATVRERADRARVLAMLGRTEEAIEALAPANDPGSAPEIESLRGTIYETRGDWDEGLTAYRAAKAAWEARPSSPARTTGVLRATTGIAYCLRKSGRYAEAEGEYQEVIALTPTADSHFLLAQFYEDTQQAEKAKLHARRAIELAPERYQREGEKLIRKLTTHQFGCLRVFETDASRFDTGSAPNEGIDRLR